MMDKMWMARLWNMTGQRLNPASAGRQSSEISGPELAKQPDTHGKGNGHHAQRFETQGKRRSTSGSDNALAHLPANGKFRKDYEIIKRGIDIVLSSVALLLIVPAWVLIVVAIRIDSPGPALIKQLRIGRNRRLGLPQNGHKNERRNDHKYRGQPFSVYKFRTMRADTDLYAVKPVSKNDARITRVGHVLRGLCLDEVPQLLNVLKGEMSIVGPRPEMPFIVEEYDDQATRRLLVKPGLTGLWQLYGSRQRHIHEELHWDIDYIEGRSLMLDMWIMFKTAKFILSMRNI